jgi:predicted phage terminase large subunit-like protein
MRVTANLPPMHKAQAAIHNSKARFRVAACGRRFGKSMLAACECLDVAARRGRAWWVAPSYPIAAVGWRALTTLAGQIPGTETRLGDRMIMFPGGGFTQVRTADAEGGNRGEGLDFIVVDEAAHTRRLLDMWQQELRPALSDRQGRALFISTPKGYNDFYELFKRDDPEWESFQFPTSANPYIDKLEIEKARAELPALVFRQEYLAEFVQLLGAMFQRTWFAIVDTAPVIRFSARGWDLAASTKASADLTVGAKVGLAANGDLIVMDVVRGRWEWPEAIRIISQTAKADGPHTTQAIEDNGQQKAMLQLIRREPGLTGLPFRGVTEILRKPLGDKIVRANIWLPRAEQGKMSIVRGNWNNAFLDVVCSFPEGTHDDDVDAVSAATIAMTQSYHGSRGT